MKNKSPWVVLGGTREEVAHCKRCGDGLKMTGSQPIYLFTALCDAFTKHHSKCKDVGRKEPDPARESWYDSRDTGTSSYTIYFVLGNRASPHDRYDVPNDPADFGRCYRLLQLFPEWKVRLAEVAKRFPAWGPMVAHWDEMTALYEEELPNKTAPKLYALMQTLRDEGRIADGWIQTAPGCWEKRANAGSAT